MKVKYDHGVDIRLTRMYSKIKEREEKLNSVQNLVLCKPAKETKNIYIQRESK